jgi:ParB family chromosome partitioning protein
VALASVVHTLGLRALYGSVGSPTCLGLSCSSEWLEPMMKTPEESTAAGALAALATAWREALPEQPEAFWGWCVEAETDRLLELLALLAGTAVNAVQRGRGRTEALRQSDQLAEALSLDMAAHWTPHAEGFFSRLTKAQLVAQLVEADHTNAAETMTSRKKADAAELAATTLGDGWLPQPLRL